MAPVALGLLLVAAILHAGWNLLAKQAADRQATLWWSMLLVGGLLAPALVLDWPPSPEVLALAVASSLFEALYFVTLVAAYEAGDLSLVYPVARGSAPLLIVCWAGLFLGERPSLGGWAGIGLVVVGLVLASAPGRLARLQPGTGPGRALLLALATGLCISGYSTINKAGVAQINPVAFTGLFHLGSALLVAPLVIRARGWKLLEPWRHEPARTAAVAAMVGGASALVLGALAIERAGYVGAVREISVILGALAGWRLLGEPFGARRTLAAGLMFLGLALIATLG